MTKVDLKKQQKKESLLDSAFHLFTTNGFRQTSISEIVSHAGVAKGTFYLYFTDKFDLRNKLIAHEADQIFMKAYQDLDPAVCPRFEDQVIFLVNHMVDQLQASPALVKFISRHLSWGFFKNSFLDDGEGHQGLSYRLYHELLEKSTNTYDNPERMLYMIIEFVSSTSYNIILYNQPMSLEQFKPHMFDMIRYMIRREARPKNR